MAGKPKLAARGDGLFSDLKEPAGRVAQDASAADPLALGATIAKAIPLREAATKKGARRQLPYSKQFTPAQVSSLGAFLRAVDASAGSIDSARRAVYEMLNPGSAPVESQKMTMAYNALLSAYTYCLVTEKKDALTAFGRAVLALPSDDDRIELVARHILRSLNGIELVLGVHELAQAGRELQKEDLAAHFAERGLGSNADGTDINGVRGWLTEAGVFEKTGWYVVDQEAFERLAGVSLNTARRAGGLDPVGLAILEQLALCPGCQSTSAELIGLLERRSDLRISRTGFVRVHLDPLVDAGLIQVEKSTAGRGGYSMRVTGTATVTSEAAQRLLANIKSHGFSVTSEGLQMPFAELLDRMQREGLSTKERGEALELFAVRLMLRMGLRNVQAAARPLGNEEIDGYAEALLPTHTRWQVQCKNTATFTVDHAAREVGLAVRNRSTALLMVTTGKFSKSANEFTDDVIRYSPYTAVRVDQTDIKHLAKDETFIFEILEREAQRAKTLREGSGGWALGIDLLSSITEP
jgi:site-specific DNA-methyltransferase (cytosine-N4-specific)